MPEGEKEESDQISEGEDDDQTTQKTEGEINDDSELSLIKSLRIIGNTTSKTLLQEKKQKF